MQHPKPLALRALTASLFAAGLLALTGAHAGERGTAYVSSQEGGIQIVDLDSLEAVGTLDVHAKGPRGLGVTADGKYLVTANKDDANLSIIDRLSGQLVKQVKIGKNPEFVRVRGDFAFVSYEPSSSGKPPAKGAAAEKDDDDDRIPARIAIIDIKKGKKLREIISGPETEGIEFSPDGKQLVVTNEAEHTITVHDMKSGRILKTVPTAKYGERPRGIKVSPDGKTWVATLEFGNKLLVLNDKFEPQRTVDTGNSPYGVAFDRSGQRVYVAAGREKMLQVFDTKSFEKVGEVATANRCWHFSFTPDDKQLLLACGKSDEVLVIDTATLKVDKRIASPGTPWGVVTYPKTPGSVDQP